MTAPLTAESDWAGVPQGQPDHARLWVGQVGDERGERDGSQAVVQLDLGELASASVRLTARLSSPAFTSALASSDPELLEASVEALVALRSAERRLASYAADCQVSLWERNRDRPMLIGGGAQCPPGWSSADAMGSVPWFASDPLPAPDSCVPFIYTSHFLEHLHNPSEVAPFLNECLRVLRPGGRVRVVVPDGERHFRALLGEDLPLLATRRAHFAGGEAWTEAEESLGLSGYLGMLPSAGQGPPAHRFAYTRKTLTEAFLAAGFIAIDFFDYCVGPHAELAELDALSAMAGERSADGRSVSLFAEVVAPTL